MIPSADGIHGFGRVQIAFYVYVALTFGVTAGLRWLGLPADLTVIAIVAVGAVLLISFWPRFAERHPEHSDRSGN